MVRKSRTENGMGQAINWRDEIALVAGPYDGNRKGWLSRAARKSGATYRQIKALYYGETTDPKLSVAESVLAAARVEAMALASQFESIAGGLNATDSDFHCHDINALIDTARKLRGLDSAGNKGEVK